MGGHSLGPTHPPGSTLPPDPLHSYGPPWPPKECLRNFSCHRVHYGGFWEVSDGRRLKNILF
jgi:hypothetical protein